MRFTVHRPDQRRASQRSHGTPCRDVPRRVHISIVGMGTGGAAEESLTLAALRGGMPAHRTTLTRERGIDSFQTSGERRPGRVHNGLVQTRFPRDLAAGLLDGAPGRADHARHPRVHEIPASIRPASMRPRQPSRGSLTSLRAGRHPRRLPDTQRRRCLVGGAVGQGQRYGDAAIDTHHGTVARTVQQRWDHRESDMPTTRRIQRHPVGLPVRQGSAAPQPHPADLRYRDPRPAPVELLHPRSVRTDDPETLVPPTFAPVRPPTGTTSPVRHRLREVPQCLLPHRPRTGPQPPVGGPRFGQLLAPHHIVRQSLTMMPVPRAALPALGSDTGETSQSEANRAP